MGSCAKRPVTGEGVTDVLAALADEDRRALLARWQATFGRDAPAGWSRGMLRRTLATAIQAKVQGSLTKRERRQLRAALSAGAIGVTGSADRDADRPPRSRSGRTALPGPGARLIRSWHGRTYEVEVLGGGQVRMAGQTYRSLSAVARAITGTRWSGPAFFGLTSRTGAA